MAKQKGVETRGRWSISSKMLLQKGERTRTIPTARGLLECVGRKIPHVSIRVVFQLFQSRENLVLNHRFSFRRVPVCSRKDFQGLGDVETNIGDGIASEMEESLENLIVNDLIVQRWCNRLSCEEMIRLVSR